MTSCRVNSIPAPSSLPRVSASTTTNRTLVPFSQRRSAWSLPKWFNRGRRNASDDPSHNASGGYNLDDPQVRQRVVAQRMAPSLTDSIFEDEVKQASKDKPSESRGVSTQTAPADAGLFRTDPDPRSRIRWERKKVIQMVRRQTSGEEPSEYTRRTERIARTERKLLHKSPLLETSVKKLGMLARQIQGKTLDDALLQMTYSKKKMAAEIKYQLEEARDLAIVSRGMGLGKVVPAEAGKKGQVKASGEAGPPLKIKSKDGKTLKISDPSSMYVAEAWVGKGQPRSKRLEIKGRGRVAILVSPSTSITVVLKEEKTRIRQHNEREAKEAKRKPWVHLPNRPVTAQRPYYSW